MLLNIIKELTSDALAVLGQSNYELLQQRQDGITKKLSREYKTLKHNVPSDSKLLFGDNCYPLKFIVMPDGYGPAMRAFPKLIRPPFFFLKSEGYL